MLLVGFALSNKATEAQTFNSTSPSDSSSLPSEENDDKYVPNHVLKDIDVELAFILGDKIEKYGGSATDFFNFLVVSLCREGRMAEANHLTQDKVKCGLFPDKAVCSIIEWHCKERKYDCCLAFIKMILNSGFVPSFASYCLVIQGLHNGGQSQQAQSLVSDLLRYNGVQERSAVLPYIDFLVKGDAPNLSHDLLTVIEQLHYRERPAI